MKALIKAYADDDEPWCLLDTHHRHMESRKYNFKQREILILRVVVGLSAEETAEAVGSTAGAVRVAQHRALSRLKSEITATGYDRA